MIPDSIPLNIKLSKRAVMLGLPYEWDEEDSKPSTSELVYLNFLINHYHQILRINDAVIAWFKRRKILLSEELMSEFQLGYADRSLGRHFKGGDGRKSEIARGRYQSMGILKPSGHQLFLGDVIVPFFDIDGDVVGIYGRRITPENRKEHIYYHHWVGGKATFFNLQALQQYNRIILTKSAIDALTLLSNGVPNVIATMGIQSFNEDHLALLKKYQPKEVVVAFDNSDTGNLTAGLVAQSIESTGIECSRLPLPRNMDINAYACSQEDHKEALRSIVECAFPFSQSYEMLATKR